MPLSTRCLAGAYVKLALGQQWAAWKELLPQSASLRREAKARPILVTGAYRSGTTWVGKMLSGRGLWHLHEPFNPRYGFWPEQFAYRRPHAVDPILDAYAKSLLSGRLIGVPGRAFLQGVRANRWGMPARLGLYRPSIRRVLIKDPNACLLSGYLARNHGFTTLLVLRHPAGFVSSLMLLGWDTASRIRGMLSDEALMDDWLHPFRNVMRAASNSSGLVSHATLYASIWTVLSGYHEHDPSGFMIVDYERLCADPEREFLQLYEKLGLRLQQDDLERHQKLTVSAKGGPSVFNVSRNTAECRKAWLPRLSQTEIQSVRDIWTRFELPSFQNDSDW